jgi:hypothetical protein
MATNRSEPTLWVVTADRDYFTEFNGRRFPNPRLFLAEHGGWPQARGAATADALLQTPATTPQPLRLFSDLRTAVVDFARERSVPLDAWASAELGLRAAPEIRADESTVPASAAGGDEGEGAASRQAAE